MRSGRAALVLVVILAYPMHGLGDMFARLDLSLELLPASAALRIDGGFLNVEIIKMQVARW